MKTVSITFQDQAWEAMQRQAEAQDKGLDELFVKAVEGMAEARSLSLPSPEERRRVLDKLWDRIDACNVEVGERPTRARTYDHRRFHRY